MAVEPSFDRAALERRMGGDDTLLIEVVTLFLEDCPVRLSEIRAAIDRRDAEALRAAAHALKGAAGYLSASRLVDAAARLEAMGRDGSLDLAADGFEWLSATASQLNVELQATLAGFGVRSRDAGAK